MASSILLRSLRRRPFPSVPHSTLESVAGNVNSSSASLFMAHKWACFAQTFRQISSKPAADENIDIRTSNADVPVSASKGKPATNPKRLERRPLRQFAMGSSKSAGRNSAGRITIFHRGGGAKRLQRRIDEKRSTSSIGVVERVEYDPNRSSQIALVRWIEGVDPPRRRKHNTMEELDKPLRKITEPAAAATVRGPFSFHSFSGTAASRRKTCASNIFLSALSSSKAKGETTSPPFSSSFDLPRIAVAGARPAFYAPRTRGESGPTVLEVRKSRANRTMKRKAAVSW